MFELIIDDMTCGHCVQRVTQAIINVDPAAQIRIDLERRQVSIDSVQPVERLLSILDDAGYPATPKS